MNSLKLPCLSPSPVVGFEWMWKPLELHKKDSSREGERKMTINLKVCWSNQIIDMLLLTVKSLFV